jgi:hypothetical protein
MSETSLTTAIPVVTVPNPAGIGRPVIAEEQYHRWLDDMAPFLKQGASLNYAMEKSGIMTHEWSIREKYRANDWFSRKVDSYRSYVGELVNMVGYMTIENIKNRMIASDGKVGIQNSEELQVWKTMAEKHRSSQPFFVTRVETSEADDSKIGKILDSMETTDYDDVASKAERQILASHPPVQNKEQAGAVGDVPAEHDPAQAPSGETQPPVQPGT